MGGTVPPELFELPDLESLQLNFNNLSGPLPDALCGAARLKELNLWQNDLDQNRFTGSLPSSLGDLKDLRVLAAGGNLLQGTLPPELGRLEYLQALLLQDNALEGALPASLLK